MEEELAGLFVAICRAAGLLARSMRALDPSPVKPTPALLVSPAGPSRLGASLEAGGRVRGGACRGARCVQA